ncbi:MAG: NAD(P)-dependent oxidoreductase [Roseivirga sp.]|uniref:SDR family oxidoreductase n=1 Tax=Roseivirga sp. TaxID=1964215 RepID=UPI001B116C2A|nr:NAD(P)-dependent oxidoreductase [Roseivirga sp.]MBO6661462.1 NAD(P)-dependent oxidoreductase [Roseivirga sp.]MBO6759959.1 NAD(P)-dependent oxidoreductase [Roseivirga sp.]MBO6908554.1 NAD(P)-dependent oxidoreductase [Roseivirga sp.]
MKILITGSNGLLGQKLVKLLLDKGEDTLIATARGGNRLPYPETDYVFDQMDITDKQQVLEVVTKHKPEVIIHTAAMTNVDQCETEREACWDQNVNAVNYLIEASAKNDCFLLHLSTDFIFDGEDGPYDEKAKANPVSYYGESKLAAEKLLENSTINYAIARTVLVYGIAHDMSRSNIILWVKKSLEEGKEIKVVDDQLRSPTLAEDLAMGCYLIAKQKAPGVFNICGKDLLNPYEMALKTADFFNLDTSTMQRADASSFTQTAKRPPRTGLLIGKARTVLGYEPHSFDEGIAIVAGQIEK